MSISPIGTNGTTPINSLSPGISSVTGNGQDADGDNGGSGISAPGESKFVSALSQALSQLGLSPGTANATGNSDPSSDTPSAQDPQQALSAFMQNLFSALHAQSNGQGAASNISSASQNGGIAGAVSGAGGGGHHYHHHHGGGMGKLEGGLQNLIQQLSSSSSQDTTGSGNSDSSSSDAALDTLQQSFNNLLSADGAAGSNVTLSTFMQALSQNLQGAPDNGNIVSTKV